MEEFKSIKTQLDLIKGVVMEFHEKTAGAPEHSVSILMNYRPVARDVIITNQGCWFRVNTSCHSILNVHLTRLKMIRQMTLDKYVLKQSQSPT